MTEDFWNWSLRAYAHPGVEKLLLALQDKHGLDINLLLWCLWCADRFEAPPEIVVRKAADIVKRWSTEVTTPLRSVRRALKEPPRQAPSPETATLRDRVKEIELSAEKIGQEMLEALAGAMLTPAASRNGVAAKARRMLAAYVRLTDAARSPGFSVTLLEELIELIFPMSESGGDRIG